MSSIKRLALALGFATYVVAVIVAQTGGGGVQPGGRGNPSQGGTVTSPILFPDGTAAAPSIAFASEPTLGFRRTSASTAYFSNNVSATALGIGPINSNAGVIINGGGSPAGIRGGAQVMFTTGAANETNAMDAGISRIAAATYGIGNGTFQSFSGTLKLAALQKMAGTGTQLGDATLTIYSSVLATGSTGGGAEADVSSYTMPANTLSSDGMQLRINVCAVHAANVNNTNLRVYVDGVALINQTEATSTAVPCTEVRLVRTTSTTFTYSGINSGGGGLSGSRGTQSGKNFAASMIIKYSVQATTTTNDLIGNHMRVEWASQ